MPKAKKLPSGNWRCLVFSHTDENGKRKYESFTAPTKSEAELLALQFKNSRSKSTRVKMTVKEAVKKYIDANDGTLSESTIAVYLRVLDCLKPLHHIPLDKLSSEDVQSFISTYKKGRSAKTVKNVISLLNASIKMFYPDAHLNYTLPTYVKPKIRVPLDDDIRRLYDIAPTWFKLCIVLGCQSVRRGEICAIKLKDVERIDEKTIRIHIHGDCVRGRKMEWVIKDTPKTPESDRFIYVPSSILDLIDAKEPEDYIVTMKPSTISDRCRDLCRRLNIKMTFHGTRHYYASVYAMMGVPDFATAEMGGWKHVDRTMKEIYQGVQENKKVEMLQAGSRHISGIISA